MSPILVRPVREQLEHDRITRLLQVKFRRRYDAGMNPGNEQNVPVSAGGSSLFPDLVLFSLERGRRLQGVIEVETGESVNHLEALAQWANFGKLRAEFFLYVPSGMVEVARRLCEDNQIHVSEIWSYHTVGDEVRFTLVHRSRETTTRSRETTARSRETTAPKPRAIPTTPSRVKPKASVKAVAAKGRTARAAKTASRQKAVKKAVRPQKRK